jgi:hypothetical protein
MAPYVWDRLHHTDALAPVVLVVFQTCCCRASAVPCDPLCVYRKAANKQKIHRHHQIRQTSIANAIDNEGVRALPCKAVIVSWNYIHGRFPPFCKSNTVDAKRVDA